MTRTRVSSSAWAREIRSVRATISRFSQESSRPGDRRSRLMNALVNSKSQLVAAVHGAASVAAHHADALRLHLRGERHRNFQMPFIICRRTGIRIDCSVPARIGHLPCRGAEFWLGAPFVRARRGLGLVTES